MKEAASCWSLVCVLLCLIHFSGKEMCYSYEIKLPTNYSALSGDLKVFIQDLPIEEDREFRLELLELQVIHQEFPRKENKTEQKDEQANSVYQFNLTNHHRWTVLGSIEVPVNFSVGLATVNVSFPCGVITRGGRYGVRITSTKPFIIQDNFDEFDSQSDGDVGYQKFKPDSRVISLDVRWPSASLAVSPKHIETYPEQKITAVVQFTSTRCPPAIGAPISETWVVLHYCGHATVGCAESNFTNRQVIYSEQIRGYPKNRSVSLRCDLFGLAGYYAVSLRPAIEASLTLNKPAAETFIKAVWSEKFIFNVHASSIFPCDTHGGGVSVLFQYPQCISESGDSVRLFARLRADVASLIPPTSLHYIKEQKVQKGKHSLNFDCNLFTERYVEYCFVYVSRAITGAMSDVRMDCVPTLPVSEADSGGWGQWSPWTSCTTSCGGGTRNRYRACDNPPPRYGAKFCEGPHLETERCGNTDWDCEFSQQYPVVGNELPANRPEVMAEVGPGCRCGCIVHLNSVKPRRLLATSSQSCPGRTLWLIQADKDHIIRLSVDHFRFPCTSQSLKVRDGDSLSSTMIGELTAQQTSSIPVQSTGPYLLIEFFSDNVLAAGQECNSGFLAHAQQMTLKHENFTAPALAPGLSFTDMFEITPAASINLTLVHAAVAFFLAILILFSLCLGVQYLHRYRKYQLTAMAEDIDSMTEDSQCSLVAVRSRAASNSTLLSEVISLRRFHPQKHKHSRLLEEEHEMDEERMSDSESHDEESKLKTPEGSLETLQPAPEDVSADPTPKQSPATPRRLELNSIKKTRPTRTMLNPCYISPVHEEIEMSSSATSSLDSRNSSSEPLRRMIQLRRKSLSSASTMSDSTLTNNSPVSSIRSTQSTNPKAKKERKNLEKLRAGSEFSLPGDADLEMDYYDYNVHNAAAVPESYIGMDPAYLVWIPPLSPATWEKESDKESEEEEEEKSETDQDEETSPILNKKNIEKVQTPRTLRREISDNKREKHKLNPEIVVLNEVNRERSDLSSIKMKRVVTGINNRCLLASNDNEKETHFEKSPSDDSEYYDVLDDDIKYADDDDDEKIDNKFV